MENSSSNKITQNVRFDDTIYYKYIPNRKEKTSSSFKSPSEFQTKMPKGTTENTSLDNSKFVASLEGKSKKIDISKFVTTSNKTCITLNKSRTMIQPLKSPGQDFMKTLSSKLDSLPQSISIKLYDVHSSSFQNEQIDFDIVKKLGEGTYGLVVEVVPISNIPNHFPRSNSYVLKIVKDEKRTESFSDEQRIMMEMKNKNKECFPHIMSCFYTVKDHETNHIYFLCEKFDGDLNEYIGKIDDPFRKMDLALETFDQVLQGLDELKDIQLFHRDLKPGNILYKIPDDQKRKRNPCIQFKITDFGISSIEEFDLSCENNNPSSLRYIDPFVYKYILSSPRRELNIDTIWTETNDIYSLSVILYEIVFGRYLLDEISQKIYFVRNKLMMDYNKLKTSRENEKNECMENMKNNFSEFSKLYENLYLENLSKIMKEDIKYKYGSRESNLLAFLIRNLNPFEQKLSIEQSKPYIRIGGIERNKNYTRPRRSKMV
jgi:serine/threonine protein kinase